MATLQSALTTYVCDWAFFKYMVTKGTDGKWNSGKYTCTNITQYCLDSKQDINFSRGLKSWLCDILHNVENG